MTLLQLPTADVQPDPAREARRAALQAARRRLNEAIVRFGGASPEAVEAEGAVERARRAIVGRPQS